MLFVTIAREQLTHLLTITSPVVLGHECVCRAQRSTRVAVRGPGGLALGAASTTVETTQ